MLELKATKVVVYSNSCSRQFRLQNKELQFSQIKNLENYKDKVVLIVQFSSTEPIPFLLKKEELEVSKIVWAQDFLFIKDAMMTVEARRAARRSVEDLSLDGGEEECSEDDAQDYTSRIKKTERPGVRTEIHEKGKIYNEGYGVGEVKGLKFGYNFAQELSLDVGRDRNKVPHDIDKHIARLWEKALDDGKTPRTRESKLFIAMYRSLVDSEDGGIEFRRGTYHWSKGFKERILDYWMKRNKGSSRKELFPHIISDTAGQKEAELLGFKAVLVKKFLYEIIWPVGEFASLRKCKEDRFIEEDKTMEPKEIKNKSVKEVTKRVEEMLKGLKEEFPVKLKIQNTDAAKRFVRERL